jgi:hypothetical protein
MRKATEEVVLSQALLACLHSTDAWACIHAVRMVHDTDIVELELRSKRFSLAVRKKEALEADAAQAAQFMYPVSPHPRKQQPSHARCSATARLLCKAR